MKAENTDEIEKINPITELITKEIERIEWQVTYHQKELDEAQASLKIIQAGLTKYLKSWANRKH